MSIKNTSRAIAAAIKKPNIGGKREGAGRPAPLGRKKTCTVRLDPQVEAFCRANGGLAVLNDMCRKSKEFRTWLKAH